MAEYLVEVTIGIPVFNVKEYVEKSVLSALDQDFNYPYEVLIVDDCGTDNSMEIVRQIAHTHPHRDRIRIVSHKYNQGLGQARNTIISHTKGRFLFF